jgi:hypothetical protein
MNNRHRVVEKLQTVRFNFPWEGRIHKITMKPGESRDFHYSRPTEEGYEYCHEELFHNGEEIEYEMYSGGRDCDGPIDRHYSYVCKVGPDLKADTNYYGDKLPKWRKVKGHVRDYYAEAMGY